MFEWKLEAGEEAGHVGISGDDTLRGLRLVSSGTQGGQRGWSGDSEGRARRGKEKAGRAGLGRPLERLFDIYSERDAKPSEEVEKSIVSWLVL